MPKQSQLPQDAAPTLPDRLTGLQVAASLAVSYTLQTLINFIWTLANIPTGATSPITRDNYTTVPFVTGNTGVWTADAAGSTRNASMTAITVFINGRFITITSVTARTFTASKDTYIDILDNTDGTGTLVYTEVTNNAASPALAANSIRIGIIITGATNILNSGSVNQGQETMILPIASSNAYSVTDSLGNLICNRDPSSKLIGYRQILATFNAGTNALTDVTGLNLVPFIVPAGRKIKATAEGQLQQSGTIRQSLLHIKDGSTDLTNGQVWTGLTNPSTVTPQIVLTPSAGSHTYKAVIECASGANVSIAAATTQPAYVRIELE